MALITSSSQPATRQVLLPQLRERLEGWSAGQTVGDLFSPELTDMLKARPPGLAAAQPLLQP